ncbi:hypothetical protein ACFXOR_09745 [Streptomyces sp. NPDC059164]|uniref:hypothetical protein n=1 Tax=Streptomyces sp. NPDC059164 TaxID=3346750 RepID=UPI0036C2493E
MTEGAVRLEDQAFLDTDDGWPPERSAALAEEIAAQSLHLLGEAEVYRHPEIAPGHGGFLAAIVQRVRDNADHHSWIAAHSPRTHVTDELPFADPSGTTADAGCPKRRGLACGMQVGPG